ncbi:hypothetical protein A7D00_0350 [Trichophyton violaceum]|uniref:Protein BIG1 n=1 Tax=Trichophyton violaceum TaxID=34388 RepID=A0A178FS73_TRIVO|nr:hypothetical protein A7D00_0350 [Trichophyton violaceum]
MQLKTCGLLALGAIASSADAFRDTSPFFLFSTNSFKTQSSQLQSASSLLSSVSTELSSCPSDFYILVSQPGVHILDFSNRRSAPRLRERVLQQDDLIKSSFSVSEVAGEFDAASLQKQLEKECKAETIVVNGDVLPSGYKHRPQVIMVELPAPPTDISRSSQLVENDGFLATLIDLLPSSNYTVLYTTSPRGTEPIAEADIGHFEMGGNPLQNPLTFKREFQGRASHDDKHKNKKKGSLFTDYQFLSPGLFMGLITTVILGTILYVGLSALNSLQVSYASFDKENGPAGAAGKKQQ